MNTIAPAKTLGRHVSIPSHPYGYGASCARTHPIHASSLCQPGQNLRHKQGVKA